MKVLAFAESIDLPGVQHQYDKIAQALRAMDPQGLIVDVLPSPRITRPEVFCSVAIRDEESLYRIGT